MMIAMTEHLINTSVNCASKKMRNAGFKRLTESVLCNLATLYRWADALNDGRGISDKAKRRLMEATAGTPDAISWSDFNMNVQS